MCVERTRERKEFKRKFRLGRRDATFINPIASIGDRFSLFPARVNPIARIADIPHVCTSFAFLRVRYGIRHVSLSNRKLRANCEKCAPLSACFSPAEEKSTGIKEYLTLITDNITLIGVHTRNMIIKLNWRSLHAHCRQESCITKRKNRKKNNKSTARNGNMLRSI